MKKLVAGLLGLVVLAVVIGIGAISVSSSSQVSETSTIANYLADFTVKSNGDLVAVETLTVDFPVPRHGIFRFFDTRDPNDSHHRFLPRDVSVTRDGADEPWQWTTQERGRIRTLKIGSADTTWSGEHVYRIGYRIPGALAKGTNGSPTQFYWNLIPQGWQMPINQSALTVHLPAAAEHVQCAVGLGESAGPCVVEGDGTDTMTIRTGALQPNTPVTVKVGLQVPTPPMDTLPWSSRFDPILGRHPVLLGGVLALAVLAGLGGLALTRSTYEKEPAFPLMYAPPDGVGPAQAAYLLTEKIEDRAFVATMMYAAEKGAVQLSQDGKAWTITSTGDMAAWDTTDDVTRNAGRSLGVVTANSSFTASPKSVTAGEKLKDALSEFKSNTKGWARTAGLMSPSGLGGFGCFALLAVWALTIWLGAFNPLHMSVLALVPGSFAVLGLGVGTSGAGTKRTPTGRDLWSRVGGFKRILSTPSAVDRFEFSGRKELYTAYLPWAVAFDCADEWAKKYRTETGEEPPVPGYFVGYTGAHTGNYVNSMVASFDSAVSSAISSYNATQSSSSGGGGGFSGGGGGGGGGGGSW
ncbi:DUF2207 domain-containing protein [Nocardioides pocheonensis]|uniref:DUF2207 domain-containing protein n=1 Tax=Nocardioides pocheonensis TaxID=661485 RepID=A0A3N0GV66_9ACTN|nr:DUF2207 domain-containing protein [Nocardioides pocheonensis]RNM16363.1 DUF2207 domain-containing protein [Nocardioides pocheonensis]